MHTRVTYTQPELCLVSVYVCGLPFSHNFTPNNRETNPSRKEAKRFVNQNSMRILIANENQYIHTHTCSLEQCQTMTEFPKKKTNHITAAFQFFVPLYITLSPFSFSMSWVRMFSTAHSVAYFPKGIFLYSGKEKEKEGRRDEKREKENGFCSMWRL